MNRGKLKVLKIFLILLDSQRPLHAAIPSLSGTNILWPHSVARDWMVGTGMADRDLAVLEANPQNRDMASKAWCWSPRGAMAGK